MMKLVILLICNIAMMSCCKSKMNYVKLRGPGKSQDFIWYWHWQASVGWLLSRTFWSMLILHFSRADDWRILGTERQRFTEVSGDLSSWQWLSLYITRSAWQSRGPHTEWVTAVRRRLYRQILPKMEHYHGVLGLGDWVPHMVQTASHLLDSGKWLRDLSDGGLSICLSIRGCRTR